MRIAGRKKAKWIRNDAILCPFFGKDACMCSFCHKIVNMPEDVHYPFCPYCLADMRQKECKDCIYLDDDFMCRKQGKIVDPEQELCGEGATR